jgi:GTP-binding protein Era
MTNEFRSGLVTLFGRPNVGKSTLMNRLVGTKISIVSAKPQTTRHRILGIRTDDKTQAVFVDTPGLTRDIPQRIHRYMTRFASGSLEGVDCALLMITAEGWRKEDEYPLELAKAASCPVVLVINKVDRTKNRRELLPLVKESSEKMKFVDVIPLSARSGDNVEALERVLPRYLPVQPALYPLDQLTDKGERFLAAELIREQIFKRFGQEVPYATAVQIETFKVENEVLHIGATIWVDREGQKPILIGAKGAGLKAIGTQARLEMQKLFDEKIFLELWVKVRSGWADNEQALRQLGYAQDE